MTGAIGLPDPDNPEDAPIETEGVGEDPGAVPDDDEALPIEDDELRSGHLGQPADDGKA